jgi:hypothetical protein
MQQLALRVAHQHADFDLAIWFSTAASTSAAGAASGVESIFIGGFLGGITATRNAFTTVRTLRRNACAVL